MQEQQHFDFGEVPALPPPPPIAERAEQLRDVRKACRLFLALWAAEVKPQDPDPTSEKKAKLSLRYADELDD